MQHFSVATSNFSKINDNSLFMKLLTN